MTTVIILSIKDNDKKDEEDKTIVDHDVTVKENCANENKYQHNCEGGTCSLPAMPQRVQHLTACFIQNYRRGLEIGQTLGYWTPQATFAK